jgi:hypothetical protein
MECADPRPDFVEGFGYIKRCSVVRNGNDPTQRLPIDASCNLPRL